MKIMNYMNLNRHPVQLSFAKNRTHEFVEIYHAHQGMELLYVHTGRGRVIVEQQFFELAAGSLVCFRPFQLHRIQMDISDQQPYIRSLFVFEPSVLDKTLNVYPALGAFFQRLWTDPLTSQVFANLDQGSFESLFSRYKPRLEQAPAGELLEEQLLFLTALVHELKTYAPEPELLGAAPSDHSPAQRQPSTAEQIMQWVEQHYGEPFELAKLAKAVHLSPSHVSALFRQAVGSSITEYVTARRIRQACLLLRTTELPVETVGLSIGLSNFSYFCQLFKKHVGVSPHRFRREITP